MSETEEDVNSYEKTILPPVDSFEGCNTNFTSLSEMVHVMVYEMQSHREHTHKNLTTIVTEVNENMTKITKDINAILSSQTMMVSICIISISVILITLKGVWDAVSNLIHFIF